VHQEKHGHSQRPLTLLKHDYPVAYKSIHNVSFGTRTGVKFDIPGNQSPTSISSSPVLKPDNHDGQAILTGWVREELLNPVQPQAAIGSATSKTDITSNAQGMQLADFRSQKRLKLHDHGSEKSRNNADVETETLKSPT
jgi:hypothetical protein